MCSGSIPAIWSSWKSSYFAFALRLLWDRARDRVRFRLNWLEVVEYGRVTGLVTGLRPLVYFYMRPKDERRLCRSCMVKLKLVPHHMKVSVFGYEGMRVSGIR